MSVLCDVCGQWPAIRTWWPPRGDAYLCCSPCYHDLATGVER